MQKSSQLRVFQPLDKVFKSLLRSILKVHGSIGRREGAGRKTKVTAEVRKLVDDKIMEDDETTAKELKKMLAESGHHACK